MSNEKILLEADNIFQLTALHRILHKSKFQERLNDLYSKFGADWSNKVLDEIIDYYKKTNDVEKLKSWEEWRQLTKDRLEYPVILDKLLSIQAFLKENLLILDDEQKLNNLYIVISPFVMDENLKNELLQELT